LCKGFGADDALSNLPGTAYSFGVFIPILVAWYLPYVRALKPVLTIGYSCIALAGVAMTAVLVAPGSNSTMAITAVTIYAIILGAANQPVARFQWEVVGRGIPESRRGEAFALAFGAGPVLAVVGSLASQLILAGTLEIPYVNSALEFHFWQFKISPYKFPL